MAVSANYLSYVLDQLRGLGALQSRRMFGGIGLYCDALFFGLIDDDVVYFKADDSNRTDYTNRGCEAFKPFEGVVSMNYYRVPEDVLEDTDDLRRWARKSVAVAATAAIAKPPNTRKKASKREKPTRKVSSRRKSSSRQGK